MKRFIVIVPLAFFIYFFSWLVIHQFGVNNLSIQSEDTIPAMIIPVTIIKHHTLYLDKYYDMMIKKYPHPDDKDYKKDLVPFYLVKIEQENNGSDITHYLSAFPLIVPLLVTPLYYFPIMFGMPINWANLTLLAHISSAIIVALSGYAFYKLVFKHFSLDDKKSLLLTGIYLFGTINFALISQALWQHGVLQLFTILCLFYLYEKKYLLSGLFLGIAVITRPTAGVFIPFIFLLLINDLMANKELSKTHIDKKAIISTILYFTGFLIPFLFFVWYTNIFYLGIQNNGYSSQFLVNWKSRFPEGFLGIWLSPSKGILVYSPVFVFSLIGFWQVIKNGLTKKDNFKYLVFMCIIIMQTLVMGRWKHWYGGWSFGYRMAADVIPFLCLLLIPYLVSTLYSKTRKLFFITIIFSITVQLYGMLFFDGIWHAAYDRGFIDTKWLWSIEDSEIVFNLRRVLVKLDYLKSACPTCAIK